MMKRILAVLIALGALAGCGNDEQPAPSTNDLFKVYNVSVNGQPVPCVVYDDANRGSELSCNWSVYK